MSRDGLSGKPSDWGPLPKGDDYSSDWEDIEALENENKHLRAERDDARENSNRFQMEVMQLRAELDEAKKNIANARLDLEWPIVKERDKLRAALERINNIAGNSGDNPMQGLLSIRDEVKRVRK
jgi:predicted  nucleic acid-binding Zn-ribbon protein